MELEDLKKGWDDLNGRLDTAEEQLRALAGRATREHADNLRRRTERRLRLPIVAAALLPLLLFNMCRLMSMTPNTVCIVTTVLLVVTTICKCVSLMIQLREIDPLRLTVGEICHRTRRLRRHLLWGQAVTIVIILPLMVSLAYDICNSDIVGAEYAMYGFFAGLAVGLPIGIGRFMRLYGDIVEMEHSFGDAEE